MSHPVFSREFEEQTYAKVTWRIIPLIIVAFVFAYYDRVNISFAKLQMQSDLGFSDAAYGLGAGLFFIGYFIFEIPSNIAMHKVGAKKWLARIMITWGLASTAMMFAYNETSFYILRFLVGAAEAGFAPGALLYLTYWFPAYRRARVNAIFLQGIVLSGLTGGPVAGFIMSTFPGIFNGLSILNFTVDLAGWQWLFLCEGIPTILLGFFTLWYLDDNIQSSRWLNTDEKLLLQGNLDLEYSGMKQHATWFSAVRDSGSIFLAVLYFMTMSGFYGFTFWMPQIIKNTGIESTLHVGLLSAIPYVAAAIAMPIMGRHSDRSGERRGHLAFCLALCATGYIASAMFQNHTAIALLALTVACMSLFSALPVFWTLPPKFLAGASAASGIAFINSTGNLSGFSSSYIVGLACDLTGSTASGLYAVAGILIVGTLMALFLMPAKLSAKDSAKPESERLFSPQTTPTGN